MEALIEIPDKEKRKRFFRLMTKDIMRPIEKRMEARNHLARLHGLCKVVGAKFECKEDHEGGGFMSIEFPKGKDWTLHRAEHYVLEIMELHLANTDGGPGQFFTQCGGYERLGHPDWPVFTWRWGYDI